MLKTMKLDTFHETRRTMDIRETDELQCVSSPHCIQGHDELEYAATKLVGAVGVERTGHILSHGEYTQVDGHAPGGHILTVGRVGCVEAQEDVAFDCEINGGLDEDGEEIKSAS